MSIAWGLAVAIARGHGGEDHAAPAAPIATADATSISTWSSEFEAVLRLDDPTPGAPVDAVLMLADFGTSAPIGAGEATLALVGPAPVSVELRPGPTAGLWPFTVTFPDAGAWGGQLTVITPDRADLLGLPAFTVSAPEARDASGVASGAAWAGGGLGLVAAGTIAFFAGRASRRSGVIAALVALGVLGAARRVSAHGGDDHAAPSAPEGQVGGLRLPLDTQFLLELRTARITQRPFAETIRALGATIARPGGAAEIHAPVTGIVSFPRTLVPGEVVTAGDVLATIRETLGGADRSSFVQSRSSARVALAEARKKLAVADRDLARVATLGAVLSERDRLDRERTVEVAREEVHQAEIASGALAESGPTTTLRSPLTGRISALLANPGDVVAPADVLFRVTDAGGLWVEAAVPETWAGQLVVGGAATLVSDARRDTPIQATVLDPGLEADRASGMLRVVLAAEGPVDWLVPGMSVTASIDVGAAREALVVPDSAIVDAGGETLVFVKVAPEAFETRPVRVGPLSAGYREVTVGLSEGERVVVQGTYALRSLAGR